MLLSAALAVLSMQQIFFSIENSFGDIKSIMKNFSLTSVMNLDLRQRITLCY